MRDTLRLLDLRFFTIVGDLPHERTTPQPVEVDIEVMTDIRTVGETDRLADGVDYRLIHQTVATLLASDGDDAPRLIETLCERIASALLSLEGVDHVRVRVRKPWAALPGPAAGVEVEIERP